MAKVTVDRNVWITRDAERLVDEGDPEAAALYAMEGQAINERDAKRLGYEPKASKEERQTDNDRE